MKILYDHQTFLNQNYGGISRYFYELALAYNHSNNITPKISILISNNQYLKKSADINHKTFLPKINFRGKQRLLLGVNKIGSIRKIRRQSFDVFHPTYYDPYFLEHIGNKPFVLTVYDMIHERLSHMFPSNDPTSKHKRLLVEKASKIIAISESTKNDLIQLFNINPSKIKVIYLGNSMVINEKVVFHSNLPKKYILFVGSRAGYKNFVKFIKSVASTLNLEPELAIICVGGGKFCQKEKHLFEKLNIENQLFNYSLSDDLLAHFYRNAIAFVFPSLYEGFGIPILEAFACGCPVICSEISSLPEVAGNAAEYFDPYSTESIKYAIEKVVFNKDIRNSLVNKGQERVLNFSWGKTALETENVYKSII